MGRVRMEDAGEVIFRKVLPQVGWQLKATPPPLLLLFAPSSSQPCWLAKRGRFEG